MDSRSWITVASGPDPNAGSRPRRLQQPGQRHGDQSGNGAGRQDRYRHSGSERGVVPQPADERQHRRREKAADEQAGERFTAGDAANPDPHGKSADRQGLGLSADRVGRYTIPGTK